MSCGIVLAFMNLFSPQRLERENASLKTAKMALETEVENLSRRLVEVQTTMQSSIEGGEAGEVRGDLLARDL